ncbi:hypothetical protein CY34DRAFT_458943 [Suillus luteus UH-Slu-Lm8-n1]|uniref:Unplaced genomic scaffold CY34scaffold_32, whole genome shotgun sequence n=1 Tax=Suillus luteus UH-Slu-Lm8-n1 TaxID=930992 RepID=A0A0D0BJN6_9AGAM|nr:hypothetical protein CY34DRAFT_458943 [Suillus luteus UH-Slu-Lm8-n1]
MVTSLGFYLAVSVISSVSTTMAVHSQPISRTVSSPALCLDGYSWMNDSKGYSPCLTVAYVEGACSGNNYVQPILNSGYSYSLPNSSTANACYCSWSSYNLMMACTLCQGTNNSAVWEWPQWSSGCTTNLSWTQEYFPSGLVLAGDASIPYWATTDPSTWTYATFNIPDASNLYQKSMLGQFYLFVAAVDLVQILLASLQASRRHLAVQARALRAQTQLTWVQ